jgi:hypothetical protein
MEALVFKTEPWEVCMPVVTDLHHFDEEQGPDRIKLMRSRSTFFQ